MLFNEPKLLKFVTNSDPRAGATVSVLFNEPKLLKSFLRRALDVDVVYGFSALQRAEIAEIQFALQTLNLVRGFSALQRAEIAEIALRAILRPADRRFQCSSTSRNC